MLPNRLLLYYLFQTGAFKIDMLHTRESGQTSPNKRKDPFLPLFIDHVHLS